MADDTNKTPEQEPAAPEPAQPVLSPIQHKDLLPPPDEGMVLNNKEIDFILSSSGAKACMVILMDEPMPCQQQREGKACIKPHHINIFVRNVQNTTIPDLLDVLKHLVKVVPPTQI